MMRAPRFFRSLRWRVQLWHGVLLAIVLAALATREWSVRVDLLKRDLDNDIYRAAFLIDAALHGRGEIAAVPPGGTPLPLGEAALLPEHRALGMYYAIWRNGESQPSEVSKNAPSDIFKPPVEHEGLLETRPELRAWFINSAPGDYVVAGRSLDRDYIAWRWMGLHIAGVAAAIWAAVMLAGWWLIGRELRPVKRIASTAEKIAAGDLTQRIATRETESELGALTVVLNETFARLEGAFTRQARFTADAAHELRTPVSVILTHAQNALADGGLEPEQRDALEACERAAQRMRRMIESLLQLARLEAGWTPVVRETVDLAMVAGEAVRLLLPVAAARDFTITTGFDSAEVPGDAGALGQVITNLVGNAIHHGREGGNVRVMVRSEQDHAVIEVADDGPGIPKEHAAHIFDRFYRVDPARTGSSGHSGLGLAISQAIVEAHGGTITVQSEAVAGATLFVRLPVAPRDPY